MLETKSNELVPIPIMSEEELLFVTGGDGVNPLDEDPIKPINKLNKCDNCDKCNKYIFCIG